MSAYELWDELIRGGWTQLSQWREDKRPEGIHLDYKEANWTGKDISDDDRKNLAKNLPGFANIEGGVLVFGAATTTIASSKLEVLNALKGVTPLDQYEERVRLYVKTSTEPPVPGVVVQKIENPSQANHGVVIVYIPVSDAGPFRALGPKADVVDRYFMRTTSDTLVMPHQILAASFGRRPPPQLRVGLEQRSDTTLIQVHVMNTGRGAARGVFVRLKVKPGQNPDSITAYGSWLIRIGDVRLSGWDIAFAHPPDELLYPGESRVAGTFRQTAEERTITTRVDCANWQPMEVKRTLTLQPNKIEWFDPPEP